MDPLQKLATIFSEFPGIGPRQSKRFVYFLLTRSQGYIEELIFLLQELKKTVRSCSRCFRFFQLDAADGNLCSICRDTDRDTSLLMIVCRDVDLEAVEKSHIYNGRYFVLGGTVPILDKNPEQRIRSKELLSVVERSKGELKEIILSLNANPEGEHTGDYVKNILSSITKPLNIQISVLGRGLSTGTELEYSDSDTIKNALKNRA